MPPPTTRFNNKYLITSSRLKHWDYSSTGYYFVTICVKNRICCLSEIINDTIKLSNLGQITKQCWFEIPNHYPFTTLDEFTIMPNHVHGIIIINNPHLRRDGACPVSTDSHAYHKLPESTAYHTLGNIIGSFKSAASTQIHTQSPAFQWQPRYHDHIIRDNRELDHIRQYIHDNHLKWNDDTENPHRQPSPHLRRDAS